MRRWKWGSVGLQCGVILVSVWLGLVSSEREEGCAYYLADSKVTGFGRGVVAGQHVQANETMFESITILVRNIIAMETMLAYYVFLDENEEFEIMMFGPMLLLNHADDENVDYNFSESPVNPPFLVKHYAFSTHTPFQTFSLRNISEGEELYTNYGWQWFKDRRIKRRKPLLNTSSSYSIKELEKEGTCLTNIYVAESSLPFAGKGVFAKKSFKKGDIVSISPALVLPRHVLVMEAEHSVLMNYCVTSSEAHEGNHSDVAILPITEAAVMNHGAGEEVNVAMEWYKWERERDVDYLSSWTASELEAAQFAPLTLKYYATRDIAAGDELFLSYGPEWEESWVDHLERMMEWHRTLSLLESLGKNLSMLNTHPPQFRAFVGAPAGMFPSSFFVDECLGEIPCDIRRGKGESDIRMLHDSNEVNDILEAMTYAEKFSMRKSQNGVQFPPVEGLQHFSNDEKEKNHEL